MARKRLNRALFGLSHPLGRYAELEDYDRINSEVLKGFTISITIQATALFTSQVKFLQKLYIA